MSKCISQYIQLYSGLQGVQCSHEHQLCDATVLGIIVQKLQRYQVSKDPDTPISYSIQEIRATLEGIKPHQYVFFDNRGQNSGCCDQSLSCKCSLPTCRRCKLGLCIKCHRNYKQSFHVNHAACFPLKDIKDKLLKIIQGVEGLELAKFARKTSQAKPAVKWDSLKYV